jgi:hypothetical protein
MRLQRDGPAADSSPTASLSLPQAIVATSLAAGGARRVV